MMRERSLEYGVLSLEEEGKVDMIREQEREYQSVVLGALLHDVGHLIRK